MCPRSDLKTHFTRRERRVIEEAVPREPARTFSRGVTLLAMTSALGIGVATSVPAMSLLTEEQVRTSAAAHFSSRSETGGEQQALDQVTLDAGTPIVRESGRLGPVQIAGELGLPASTVHAVLVCCRINRLCTIDRVTGEPIRRYEHDHPGSLIHVDVTKFGNIPNGGG